ncbi:MAG: serine protease [Chloroflexi bacterium]|nr:serine protease [Chloroflexota bacterium]
MSNGTHKKEEKGVRLTKAVRLDLYTSSNSLDLDTKNELGLNFSIDGYVQDPAMAAKNPKWGIDQIEVKWEPSISNGPTSAQIAVVDYNGDSGALVPAAKWDAGKRQFLDERRHRLDRANAENFQFHQVNVWATIQRALALYEGPDALGMPISWAFEGNRLIVVPHAGYGQNAFYDRQSKSIQFYYYQDADGKAVYTCLSADIIHHELAHAVLDFVRPRYLETFTTIQNAAFHEFFGDISAVLFLMRNNGFRQDLGKNTDGDLTKAKILKNIAEQFGETVADREYLRTADNPETMDHLQDNLQPHDCSQVLTGTMFEILLEISYVYKKRGKTVPQALWNSIQRVLPMILHALHFLPPVDVTYKDYALAFLRALELYNPLDPSGYYQICLNVFKRRKILTAEEIEDLAKPHYLYYNQKHTDLQLKVNYPISTIMSSKAAAYRFLNDNRSQLFIPPHHDIVVSGLYTAWLSGRPPQRMGNLHVVEYVWEEEHLLEGAKFGKLEGKTVSLPCGGTLVYDQVGNLLFWINKPGTEFEQDGEGQRRLLDLFTYIEKISGAGMLALAQDAAAIFTSGLVPPVLVHQAGDALSFSLTPHLSLSEDKRSEKLGARKWSVSS